MEKKFINIGTEELAYVDEGQGPVIVLIHGNMSSSIHFEPLIEGLKDSFRCVAPDMRGFGDSTYNSRFDSLGELAEDIKLFMDKMDIKEAFVIGWSTGGGVGLELAARYPEMVKKLFVIEGTSHKGYPLFKKDEAFHSTGEAYETKEAMATDIQVAPMLPVFETKNVPAIAAVWKNVIYVVNEPTPEQSELWLAETLKERCLVDVDWSLAVLNMSDEPSAYGPGDGTIKNVKCPAAFTSGEQDLVVPRAYVLENVNGLGDLATFIPYENCGHSPFVDVLPKLTEDVKNFFA